MWTFLGAYVLTWPALDYCNFLFSFRCDLVDGSGKINLQSLSNSPEPKWSVNGTDNYEYSYNPCIGFNTTVGAYGLGPYYDLAVRHHIIVYNTVSQWPIFDTFRTYHNDKKRKRLGRIPQISFLWFQCRSSNLKPALPWFVVIKLWVWSYNIKVFFWGLNIFYIYIWRLLIAGYRP